MTTDFFEPFRAAMAPTTPIDPASLSDPFLDRVRRAYQTSTRSEAAAPDSVWVSIGALQADIHAALVAPDNDALRTCFRDPALTNLYYGTDNLARGVLDSVRHDLGPVKLATEHLVRGQVIKLAEAVGLRRWLPPNGEQAINYYPADHEVAPEVETILARLSAFFGFELAFPSPFAGELGLETSRGSISYRAVQAIYQYHRIRQEAATPRDRILEIGPGMGRTALLAHGAGLQDYTTIDLPIGVAGQACFLGATLGPDKLWMIGDHDHAARNKIKLLPSTLPLLPNARFDVALNVDSLVEMGTENSAAYAGWIAETCRTFISVNHEAGGPLVADLGRRYFAAARSRRSHYWMRDGYVEELFQFDRPD